RPGIEPAGLEEVHVRIDQPGDDPLPGSADHRRALRNRHLTRRRDARDTGSFDGDHRVVDDAPIIPDERSSNEGRPRALAGSSRWSDRASAVAPEGKANPPPGHAQIAR